MTGDVLPCFDASMMTIPEDTSCIITVPITLDVASNHGVIVAAQTETPAQSFSVSLVDNLLQKPTLEELFKSKAVLDDGRTLLDTGIIAVKGKAWLDLVTLACSCQQLITGLIKSRKEVCYPTLALNIYTEVLIIENTLQGFFLYVLWRFISMCNLLWALADIIILCETLVK